MAQNMAGKGPKYALDVARQHSASVTPWGPPILALPFSTVLGNETIRLWLSSRLAGFRDWVGEEREAATGKPLIGGLLTVMGDGLEANGSMDRAAPYPDF